MLKKKTTFKKCANIGRENVQKVGGKIHENSKQFNRVSAWTCMELQQKKNPPTQWVRVEYKLIYFGLY